MEDREMNYKYGSEPTDLKYIYLEAIANGKIERMYFELNDGTIDFISRDMDKETYEEFAKFVIECLKKAGSNGKNGEDYGVYDYKASKQLFRDLDEKYRSQLPELDEVNADENLYSLDLTSDDALAIAGDSLKYNEAEFTDDYEDEEYEKKEHTLKHIMIGTAVGFGLATAIAGCAAWNNHKEAKAQEAIVAEADTDMEDEVVADTEPEKVSIDGQDFAFYQQNVEESSQKDLMTAIHNFTMNFNNSEDWMQTVLTEEQIAMLQEAGIYVDGNEAIFGITAEQGLAANLAYGNLSNEEIASIMNGEFIDIDSVYSSSESLANQFVDRLSIYYMISDQKSVAIEDLIPSASEEDIMNYHRFESMLKEQQDLFKAGNYKEAEAKMKEFKHAMAMYANQTEDQESTLKPLTIKAFATAGSVLSQITQYKDTITISLYNNVTGQYEDKEVTTALFDELSMRDWVLGYKGCTDANGNVYVDEFDQIEFLKEFKIDTNKYTLVINDRTHSKVDEFNAKIVNNMENYNEFITKLTQEEKDALTKYTYDDSQILEKINDDLKLNNKYPKNIAYFSMRVSEISIQTKNKLDGGKGSSITTGGGNTGEQVIKNIPPTVRYVAGKTTTTTTTSTSTRSWTETSVSEKREIRPNENFEKEWNAIPNKKTARDEKTKVTDGKTGKEKETSYQDIINKQQEDIVNSEGTDKSKLKGQDVKKTNLDDDDKLNTKDPAVKTIINEVDTNKKTLEEQQKKLEEEANKRKELTGQETITKDDNGTTHYETGGEEHIDDTHKEADMTDDDDFARRYNEELDRQRQQQEQEQQQQEQQQEQNNGGYSNTDPTQGSGFAPAVDIYEPVGSAPVEENYDDHYATTPDASVEASFTAADVDNYINSLTADNEEIPELESGYSK